MFWSSCFEYHKQHCVCVRRKEGEGGREREKNGKGEGKERKRGREVYRKGVYSSAVLLTEVGWLARD